MAYWSTTTILNSGNTLVLDSKTSTTISEERLPDEGYLLIYLKSATIIQYTIKGRFMSR